MINAWISIEETGLYPEDEEAVWMYDAETESVWLGSYSYLENEGWFWTVSNGTIYVEDGLIKTETLLGDDYKITHWCSLPLLKDFISIEEIGAYPVKDEVVWVYEAETNSIWLGSYTLENNGWVWAISGGIVDVDDGKIYASMIYDDDFKITYDYKITHWCPLPLLPSFWRKRL